MGERQKPLGGPREAPKGMGTDFVLDDLKKKFEPGTKNRENETWQERLARKKREQNDAVEGAEQRQETYSQVEITRLQEIRRHIDAMVADFEQQSVSLRVGTREYIETARKTLSEVISYLNGLNIWSQKFTTMVGGGMDDELKISDEDSIYYLTRSGLSMRVKRAALLDGHALKISIQPVMDLLLFQNPEVQSEREEYVKTPTLGWIAKDYLTSEFKKRMQDDKSNDDFQTPLVTFEKGGVIVGVAGPADAWIHGGDRVNEIFRR